MKQSLGSTASGVSPATHRRCLALFVVLGLYLLGAYILTPALWSRYARHHPALEHMPDITHTGNGIPGDPINVALVGSEEDLVRIMLAAKWYPADPLSLRSSLRIAADSVLRRPYDDAPVSSLYFWGHRQDLAFEQPVGDSPRKRHHVRFWKSPRLDAQGHPLWAGSITYDERVGFSHTTGQITHHVDWNVDAERDALFRELRATGRLSREVVVDDFHTAREGRNGGGDLWKSDGRLFVGWIGVTK